MSCETTYIVFTSENSHYEYNTVGCVTSIGKLSIIFLVLTEEDFIDKFGTDIITHGSKVMCPRAPTQTL